MIICSRAAACAAIFLLLWPAGAVQAAHPLITEDTGTQGAGHFQFELTGAYTQLRENAQQQYLALNSAVLTYGFLDHTDVILTAPHLRMGAPDSASGFTDVALDLKWRFYESGPLSLAFKPGFTFPTGNDSKNIGTGELGWSAYLVGSYDPKPWAFHLHFGHLHNNNTLNDRTNIWHLSAAAVRILGDHFKLALDTGAYTNTDRSSNSHLLFVIAGLIWTPQPNLDFDVGVRSERTDNLHGLTALAGATVRW